MVRCWCRSERQQKQAAEVLVSFEQAELRQRSVGLRREIGRRIGRDLSH